MTDEPHDKDAIRLFAHLDQKVDRHFETASRELSVSREFMAELKKALEKVEGRVDYGVAVTGQENKAKIHEHDLKLKDVDNRFEKSELRIDGIADSLRLIGAAVSDLKVYIPLIRHIYKGLWGLVFLFIASILGYFASRMSWFQ